jgi:hypothetical protein
VSLRIRFLIKEIAVDYRRKCCPEIYPRLFLQQKCRLIESARETIVHFFNACLSDAVVADYQAPKLTKVQPPLFINSSEALDLVVICIVARFISVQHIKTGV